MPGYLNALMFRFNHRPSRRRGTIFYCVLDLAVALAPVRYNELIARGPCYLAVAQPGLTHRAWHALLRTAQGEEIRLAPAE